MNIKNFIYQETNFKLTYIIANIFKSIYKSNTCNKICNRFRDLYVEVIKIPIFKSFLKYYNYIHLLYQYIYTYIHL